MIGSNYRIPALEYLRGFAALLVLFGHIVISGTTDLVTPKTYLPSLVGAPLDQDTVPLMWFYHAPEAILNKIGISIGHLGVAIFFLLSGFVIVRPVEQLGAGKFLIGRAFRVLPSLLVVTFLSAMLLSLLFGSSVYQPAAVIASAFLVSPFLGVPDTVPVLWTLIVESWFYVLLAAVFAVRKTVDNKSLVIVAVLASVIALCSVDWAVVANPAKSGSMAWRFAITGTFVVQILVGSAIYNWTRGFKWSGYLAIFLFVLSGALHFLLCIFAPEIMSFSYSNCVAAAMIFAVVFLARNKIGRLRVPSFFADLSYPLYLVHIPLGWLITAELVKHGIVGHFNLAISIVACLTVAWLIHVSIEAPVYRVGKLLVGLGANKGAPPPHCSAVKAK